MKKIDGARVFRENKENKLWTTLDGIIDILLSPSLPLHKRIANHLKLVNILENKNVK